MCPVDFPYTAKTGLQPHVQNTVLAAPYRGGSKLAKLVWNMDYCTPQMMIEAKLLSPNPNEESFSALVESEFWLN